MNAPIRKHDGKGRPVPLDTLVVAKRRSGEVTGYSPRDGIASAPVPAHHLGLSWIWAEDSDHPLDVVAYREARSIGEIIKPIMAEIATRVEPA
jgi:hypothetical protein